MTDFLRSLRRLCVAMGVANDPAGDRVVREMRIKVNLFLQLLGNGLVQGAGAMLCAT